MYEASHIVTACNNMGLLGIGCLVSLLGVVRGWLESLAKWSFPSVDNFH